jgi:Gamma tubulin complex component C-terminal
MDEPEAAIPLFTIVFDSDAMGAYDRLFTALMKVRLVEHALERLWMVKSRLAQDRTFCQVRHSMHFFISNLLYHMQVRIQKRNEMLVWWTFSRLFTVVVLCFIIYLSVTNKYSRNTFNFMQCTPSHMNDKVDVVDSEFSTLIEEIEAATEFQTVLRAHRNFIAAVTRLSSVDNLTVQEAIERVLQVCLRFIAVCRLLHQQEDNDNDNDATRGWSSRETVRSQREDTRDDTDGDFSRHDGDCGDGDDGDGDDGDDDDRNDSVGNREARKRRTRTRTHRQLPVVTVIPAEEIESIRKEFFTQISYLFQVMRKVENRGFMFRLDFNGYLSELASDIGAGIDR